MSRTYQTLTPDGSFPARWSMPGLPIPCTVVATEPLLSTMDDEVFAQASRCCRLPGALRAAIMPDAHTGFGPCVGFAGAWDSNQGVIIPYGVGADIGCGMRVMTTNLTAKDFSVDLLPAKQRAKLSSAKHSPDKQMMIVLRHLMHAIETRVPVGPVGHQRDWGLDRQSLVHLAQHGLNALQPNHKHRIGNLVKRYGALTLPDDFVNLEESCLPVDKRWIDDANLTNKTMTSVRQQVGTLGSGNHFIEIQTVAELPDPSLAEKWGLFSGQLVVMIHSGSRHWGKTLCDYYTSLFRKDCQRRKVELEDRNLAHAPVGSELFESYFNLMNAACNYAVANRHVMSLAIREALQEVFGRSPNDLRAQLLYDLSHNNAKWEEWENQSVIVLRKGATHAFPAGHPQLQGTRWQDTGHPVITPGSMGSASYILAGRPESHETLYSINHGAGRAMSRNQAKKSISDAQFWDSLGGVLINHRNSQAVKDEAPDAYKNISEIIRSVELAQLARVVAKLKPLAVIKG